MTDKERHLDPEPTLVLHPVPDPEREPDDPDPETEPEQPDPAPAASAR